MKRPSNQLFAGSTLASDEYRGWAISHALDDIKDSLHRLRRANESESVTLSVVLAELGRRRAKRTAGASSEHHLDSACAVEKTWDGPQHDAALAEACSGCPRATRALSSVWAPRGTGWGAPDSAAAAARGFRAAAGRGEKRALSGRSSSWRGTRGAPPSSPSRGARRATSSGRARRTSRRP